MNLHFHGVEDCERSRFEAVVDMLEELGPIVALEEAIERSRRGDREAVFSLSFDDGYRNLIRNALPFLERRHVPATLFVATGILGLVGEALESYTREGIRWHVTREPLSPEDVRAVASKGFTIGSHGVSHRDFSALSAREAREELGVSREVLSDLARASVVLFSWPFGKMKNFPDEYRALAHGVGYRELFSGETRWRRGGFPPHVHPRRQLSQEWSVRVNRYFAARG